MSNFQKRKELYQKTKKLEKEIVNAPSIWDIDSEEEQKNIAKIKQKWQRKQTKTFNQLQRKKSEQKQIKKVVSGLLLLTIALIITPFLPTGWQLATNLILGSSSESNTPSENRNIGSTTDTEDTNMGTLEELNEMTTTATDEQAESINNKGNLNELNEQPSNAKNQNAPITEKKGLSGLVDQVKNVKDKQKEHNSRLQKAIDMSDGKSVSLEGELE